MPDAQQTLITVTPDGKVGANFTGHISALGLDFNPADSTQPIPPEDQIRWVRKSDGTAVAYIGGEHDDTPPNPQVTLRMRAQDPYAQAVAKRAFADIEANVFGGGLGGLTVQSNAAIAGGQGSVDALATNGTGAKLQNPRIIDSDGQSSFLQLPAFAKTGIIAGSVTGATAAITNLIGSATLTRTAAGTYTLGFGTTFVGLILACMCVSGTGPIVRAKAGFGTSTAPIETGAYGGSPAVFTLADANFHFIGIGTLP